MHKITWFGCVGFATASSAFGEPYSLLELPPQRSTKEAFLQYSRPLEEVDKERLQKLRSLGYNETFRVVSFKTILEGFKKSEIFKKAASTFNFDLCIKDYEKVLEDCIKAIPCSFCFCDTESKIYDFPPLPSSAIDNKKSSFLACLRLKPWWEKSKQILALYDFLLKDKVELKFMDRGSGFCYVKAVGDDRRYVIHFTNERIFHHSILAHEIKHALYYELGLSGDPALCSYTTKFIRDVYRLPQNFSSGSVTERSVEAIYNQCPAIAMDWDTIEEAWNKLGFIEIGAVVYINELSDCALPFDEKRDTKDDIPTGFRYHRPLFMRSHIFGDKDRWNAFIDRQDLMINRDSRTGKWKDFDAEDLNNAEGSQYLKAISVALKIPTIPTKGQGNRRQSYLDSVKEDKKWHSLLNEAEKSNGIASEK